MPPQQHNFLRLVKERHDPNLTKKHVCPYCGSKNVKDMGTSTTLLVGPRNHFHTECTCRSCGKQFNHHWKEQGKHWKTGEVQRVHWYLDRKTRKVLAGIPGCYEPYVWTCKHCGGDVRLETLSGGTGIITRLPGDPPKYEWRFKCQGCGRSAKSMESGWSLPSKPGPKPPPLPPGQKSRWFIEEGIGVGVFNPRGLKSLTLNME